MMTLILNWLTGNDIPQPVNKQIDKKLFEHPKPALLIELIGHYLPEGRERTAIQKLSNQFGRRFSIIDGKVRAYFNP